MPGGAGEADRAEPAERATESNSVRFSESQRDADRVRGGDGGESSERPEPGDRGDSSERAESGDRAEPAERTVLGDPDRLAEHWHYQGQTNDCAIYSEGGVLEASDRPFDAEQSRLDGKAEGTYSEGGTTFDGMGRVLERGGVEVDRYGVGGTPVESREEAFATAEQALSEGKAVIAVVDSGPLRGVEERGYHAVWVTGKETTAEGEEFIVTNDPAEPDGAGKQYSIERFNEAWSDAEYTMVVTRDPLPEPEDK